MTPPSPRYKHPRHIVLTFDQDVDAEALEEVLDTLAVCVMVDGVIRGYIAYDNGFGQIVRVEEGDDAG